jgi:hypothetical protein
MFLVAEPAFRKFNLGGDFVVDHAANFTGEAIALDPSENAIKFQRNRMRRIDSAGGVHLGAILNNRFHQSQRLGRMIQHGYTPSTQAEMISKTNIPTK